MGAVADWQLVILLTVKRTIVCQAQWTSLVCSSQSENCAARRVIEHRRLRVLGW